MTVGFKILLTENTSVVGAALFKALENHPYSLICPDYQLQDWCDEQRVLDLLEPSSPAVIINPLHCFEPQAVAEEPCLYQALASVCAQRDLTVIHLSSSLVFGVAQQAEFGAAGESLTPEPDTDLGQALRQAELAFAQAHRTIILRLPWLLDGESGMIAEACKALSTRETVVASEQWRVAPVYVEDVVRTCVAMVQQILCGAENWGVYHLHSSDACSEAEFIGCIARHLTHFKKDLAAIALGAGEERFFPGNGWLEGSRCTNDFGTQRRSWRKGIKAKVRTWVKDEVEAGRLELSEEGPAL